jgi:pyruvate dehydrogenase E2 component (dihydrolipoamide acetyltransferase)
MRKTIARRLTESKQQIPHIYLTVDIRLDALLTLRGELNASLASRNIKLSVNDMLIKALAACADRSARMQRQLRRRHRSSNIAERTFRSR